MLQGFLLLLTFQSVCHDVLRVLTKPKVANEEGQAATRNSAMTRSSSSKSRGTAGIQDDDMSDYPGVPPKAICPHRALDRPCLVPEEGGAHRYSGHLYGR